MLNVIKYGTFGEGSQILTNQKRESTVFWLLIDFKKFFLPGEIF